MITAMSGRRRISKREFISRVAERSGMSIKTVSSVYEGIFDELTGAVSSGETVVLTGFGRFYLQTHKGHKVRFGRSDVDDYSVLKFSASRSVRRQLESSDDPREGEVNAEDGSGVTTS
ncbi:HU family DNA-binding protein [Actinomadura geliboluensis]|uniref:HU family DNA-binding protein n=1 Tax=Actinomadura geliboluensis TaxID=882440 RepID=UPI0037183E9E